MIVDRGEFYQFLQWLDGFYRSGDGLGREHGLAFPDPPRADLEGIAAWGFDQYLNARERGETPDQARSRVASVIRQSDEWRARHPPDPDVPLPAVESLLVFPRRGASLYGFADPEWDHHEFLRRIADCGMNFTRTWSFGGWRPLGNPNRFPVRLRADNHFDLNDWDESYFDAAEAYVEHANSLGICVQWTGLDLYTWSDRKHGLPGIPDARQFPMRNNVNGVMWGDDRTFDRLPDQWLTEFIERLMARFRGRGVIVEVGNEMPERPMHWRIADVIKRVWPEAIVTANRNVDSPGQYANMDIGGGRFSYLACHGWLPKRMDEVFPDEARAGRPSTWKQLVGQVGGSRLIASSDGAREGRVDPNQGFDFAKLSESFKWAWDHGMTLEHMSQAKLSLYSWRRHELTIETDFLKQMASW